MMYEIMVSTRVMKDVDANDANRKLMAETQNERQGNEDFGQKHRPPGETREKAWISPFHQNDRDRYRKGSK